jgi:thiosulfate/3-mercaptopyruvate sulfurtransferase
VTIRTIETDLIHRAGLTRVSGARSGVVTLVQRFEYSFSGDEDGYGPRRGHIPCAINVPFRSLIKGETADFQDADVMFEVVRPMTEQQRVITYCGGAIAATVNAFALKLFGFEHVRVYDGSLVEWSADEPLPMGNSGASQD